MTDEKIKEDELDIGLANEICIWKNGKMCVDCNLDEVLFCKPEVKYMIYFMIPFLIIIIPVILGVIFSDINIVIKILFFIGWFSYAFFFLNVWESRMLCNHCPYYANDAQKTLRCPIDRGKLKTGKYDPGPSSTSEKIQFIVGMSLLIGFPVPLFLLYNLILPLVFLLFGTVLWISSLQLKICTDCVNYACPLNRVPEDIRNEFFNRNPVIKKAWEEKGYEID
ncbi:MAG: hypothetical protein ACOC44_15580 [Promethearchaeia archaeon]